MPRPPLDIGFGDPPHETHGDYVEPRDRFRVVVSSRLTWGVVIPSKPLRIAKSRLRVLGDARTMELAAAMFEDCLVALSETVHVGPVVSVTNDRVLSTIADSYGVITVADPGRGLNAALLAGSASIGGAVHAIAYLAADLPCLTGTHLDACLVEAGRLGAAVVPDTEGRGSTMLMHRTEAALVPYFGPDSLRRHVALGAQPMWRAHPAVRRDVDVPDDLGEALMIGVGRLTRSVCSRHVGSFSE